MSITSEILDALETQLQKSTVVTDPDNIFPDELVTKFSMKDDMFPRLEYLAMGEDNFIYINQQEIQPLHWFTVSGYLRIPKDGTKEDKTDKVKARARQIAIGDFAHNTVKNIYEMNKLRMLKTLPIVGFQFIHSLNHIVQYRELVARTDSFIFNFAMIIDRPYLSE